MSKVKSIVSEVKLLSVIELSELISELQGEFGVTGASFVANSSESSAASQEKAEVKSTFKLELIEIGGDKPKIIKALRQVKKELGLIEAKNATENLPYIVFTEANKEDVDSAKKILEEAGAKIKIS